MYDTDGGKDEKRKTPETAKTASTCSLDKN